MKRILLMVLIASLLLPGCGVADLPVGPSSPTVILDNTTILPKNVIQIGDSFEVYPDAADGHFVCTVTDVRVVSEQSECPPQDQFWEGMILCGFEDGEPCYFEYDEWFTEGGAFDHGCRVILVDLTVTNVDAVAWLDNGTFTGDCGYYFDDYVFPAGDFVYLALLSRVVGSPPDQYYGTKGSDSFSLMGEYIEAAELTGSEITDSLGNDYFALMARPGETVSFTVGYGIEGNEDGTPPDLSMMWLCLANRELFNLVNNGIFIDTKLGEET